MNRLLVYLFLAVGVCLCVPLHGRAQTGSATSAGGAAPFASSLPTVDQIVERAILASGGKTAWSKINSMYVKGSVEIPAGHVTGTFEIYSQAPNKSYESITLGGAVVMKQGFDGANAWKITPGQGVVEVRGDELEDAKLDSDFYSEIDLTRIYPQMVLQGESTIAARPCYVVLATPLHGKARKLYFDKTTGLRVGMSTETTSDGKIMRSETYFEDFRTVDGIQVPHAVHVVTPDVTMVFHLLAVKTNIPILDWTFLKPASKAVSAKTAPSSPSTASAEVDTGGVSGNTFSSSQFGFMYTFPEGWTAHGSATNRELMKVGKELVAGNDPARNAAYDAAETRTSQLLTVFQYPVGTPVPSNPSVQVIAERVDFAPGIKTGKDYLLNLEAVMKRGTLQVEFADEITESVVGGKQFFRLDDQLHFPAAVIRQSVFSAKLGDSVVSFIFTAKTQQELDLLCATLDSLKFDAASQ